MHEIFGTGRYVSCSCVFSDVNQFMILRAFKISELLKRKVNSAGEIQNNLHSKQLIQQVLYKNYIVAVMQKPRISIFCGNLFIDYLGLNMYVPLYAKISHLLTNH